jgi:hypothetical protein
MLVAMRRASSLVNRKRALTDLRERVRAKAIGGRLFHEPPRNPFENPQEFS